MKNLYKEKNKLPLTFKYIEIFKTKNSAKLDSNSVYYSICKKYQTDFYIKEKPCKPFSRLL
ncbi:Uncharacterised protein [Chryseobacterium nakagawai]|uniref:Uncharacterized protein n=1 Tax=Chryseobacterium nakagawai TaxID=1241982 RepID=A0AAD0YPS2_CHRNA|nr:hypothetical protein EG343_18855 [Chryseobacterium nakagawai]VEH19093.1 Uncharacterised protein [Chryseobacterium nakagawai]